MVHKGCTHTHTHARTHAHIYTQTNTKYLLYVDRTYVPYSQHMTLIFWQQMAQHRADPVTQGDTK